MHVGIPCVVAADLGLPSNFFGCLSVNSLIIVLTQISIFGLLVIAIERFYAIRYPYDYCLYCTPTVAAGLIAVTWFAGAFVGLIPIFGWNKSIRSSSFFLYSLVTLNSVKQLSS